MRATFGRPPEGTWKGETRPTLAADHQRGMVQFVDLNRSPDIWKTPSKYRKHQQTFVEVFQPDGW